MTPTISPASGVLPQAQYAPGAASMSCCQQSGCASMATGVAPDAAASGGGGGAVGAVQGVQGLSEEQSQQVVQLLTRLVDLVNQLVQLVQQRGGMQGLTGAAPISTTSGGGANAAPTAPQQSRSDHDHGGGGGGSTSVGNVDPSTVKDKASLNGLNDAPKRGLEIAHTFGLPLVSGKRSGGGRSDHDHGNAIDVGTLPIGVPESDGGTPQMKAYAEYMRQQGKAGNLDVKYVILDGKIASSRDNWAWRTYTHPDQTAASLERLKSSNRGEYNRLQHYDHVHVSFN